VVQLNRKLVITGRVVSSDDRGEINCEDELIGGEEKYGRRRQIHRKNL